MSGRGRPTALELAAEIRAGKVTSYELTEEALARVEEVQRNLNAFTDVWAEEALLRAREVDSAIRAGRLNTPLAGIPIAIKDNICTKGFPTTVASKILCNYIPPYNAFAYEKVLSAGLVAVGKTNLDEFAMGSSSETSCFGPVRNPHDREYSPGGSSGGSASAVGGGAVLLALGSDCGGSIRQPAAFCGAVGVKPSYGLVSRYGLVSFIPSTDQIGPVADNVGDCAALLSVIAGNDPRDTNSIPGDREDYLSALDGEVKGWKVGLLRGWLSGVEEEIKGAVEGACQALAELGCQVEEVELPTSGHAVATYYLLADAEASSNLARFDGVNFGLREGDGGSLREMLEESRGQGFGAEVKRRIMVGTFILSHGYKERYYKKALSVRERMRSEFEEVFENYQALLCPVSPTPPFKIGEKIDEPLQMYLADKFVCPINLVGICGLSLPWGETGNGLPLAVQLIGPVLGEGAILRLAKRLEEVRAGK